MRFFKLPILYPSLFKLSHLNSHTEPSPFMYGMCFYFFCVISKAFSISFSNRSKTFFLSSISIGEFVVTLLRQNLMFFCIITIIIFGSWLCINLFSHLEFYWFRMFSWINQIISLKFKIYLKIAFQNSLCFQPIHSSSENQLITIQVGRRRQCWLQYFKKFFID